jgi:dynein heavy chain 2
VARLARFQDEIFQIREALSYLSKTGLTEMATFKKPPKNVEDCMAGVLILLGEDDLSWLNASNRMRESDFMKRLLDFNYENVPLALFRRLERHIKKNPEAFEFETVMKQSVVCASFVKWVMFSYKFYQMQYPEKDEGG